MKDNIWWLLLLVAGALMIDNAFAGEWNEKPVMCEQKEIFEKIMVERGEILFSQGDHLQQFVTQMNQTDIHSTSNITNTTILQSTEHTFTFAEYHASINSVCILAFGENRLLC